MKKTRVDAQLLFRNYASNFPFSSVVTAVRIRDQLSINSATCTAESRHHDYKEHFIKIIKAIFFARELWLMEIVVGSNKCVLQFICYTTAFLKFVFFLHAYMHVILIIYIYFRSTTRVQPKSNFPWNSLESKKWAVFLPNRYRNRRGFQWSFGILVWVALVCLITLLGH